MFLVKITIIYCIIKYLWKKRLFQLFLFNCFHSFTWDIITEEFSTDYTLSGGEQPGWEGPVDNKLDINHQCVPVSRKGNWILGCTCRDFTQRERFDHLTIGVKSFLSEEEKVQNFSTKKVATKMSKVLPLQKTHMEETRDNRY